MNNVGELYLPDADDVDLEQVQNEFPLSCSTNDNNDETNQATSQPLLSSQDSAAHASSLRTATATDDDSLFDYLTIALSGSIPAPYADDFYVPILQETFNESEQIDHLTGLVLVNELIDLHNAYIRTASTTKPLRLQDPTPKAQSAIQMLTKICPTPGYVALLNHVLTHETVPIENALTLVTLWRKAHALAIDVQSIQSC